MILLGITIRPMRRLDLTLLTDHKLDEALSERELEIIRLMAEGRTNREIAQELILSPETVKWYNKRSFSKLGVGSRTEAVVRANEYGLLDKRNNEATGSNGQAKRNLPADLSSFIGRKQEIADVVQLFGKARLVTLTGPGGIGKTRLGLKIAEVVARNYADGVAYVSLAGVTDPALVATNIIPELGVIGREDRSAITSLKRYLRDKKMLLVLDNFEHVLESAQLVAELLVASPQLAVLVTSREALRLSGEYEYLVPPLTVPVLALGESISDLLAYDSMTLFVQRAQASVPDFQLSEENASAVAGICSHLDGLPLAIELAAARIKLFSPQQLLERLDNRFSLLTSGARDLPPRQQTLQNTIDWSYDLLDENEQRLFARLAVFAGGCTLESAAAICSLRPDTDFLAGIESLLYKSLIYQEVGPGGEPRFLMLDTIHEYASERLSESGEERPLRNKHLTYYLALAETFEPEYRHQNQMQFLARTEAEFDNLQLAFAWAMDSSNYDSAARLVSAIDYYLNYSNRMAEGYRLFKRAFAHIDDISPERRVRFLQGAARLACTNSDLSQGRHFCQQGLELAKKLGDRRIEAWLEIELAILSIDLNQDIEDVINRCQQGLAVLQELDYKPEVAFGLNVLGEILRTAGKYDQALEAYKESLAVCHETGEIFRQVLLLTNLSFVAYHDGDFEKAKKLADDHLQKMLEISWKKPCDVYSLAILAGPLGQLGEPEKGARLLGASVALMEEMGADFQPTDTHEYKKYKDDLRAKLDESTFKNAWAEGQAMTLEQAVAYALDE
jgi:predicted ATPase/DNA-binding CsgD family transcriptional regulator